MSVEQAAAAPIFVGIGGDSGSGKSTLANAFYELLGRDRITTVCLDDYHSLDRSERALVGLTPLNPRANNFALMEEQLWALKRGESIAKPVYDHADGTFKAAETVDPNEVVIVQGLHPFLLPGVREAFDLKVWLDPETELRIRWKLQRDVAKRGYNEAEVRAEIEARRTDAEAHIQPQRAYADLVVRFSSPPPELTENGMDHLNVRLIQRHSLPQLDFEHGLDNGHTVRLRNDVDDEDGRRADVIDIDGRISVEDAEQIEDAVWRHASDLHHRLHHLRQQELGAYDEPSGHRHSDPLGLTQLILAHRILSAQKSLLVRVRADDFAAMSGHITSPHISPEGLES
ncbi:MAG TPA: phosphoribulokinase [Candidatus Dormibacteraeota bacterium]|jgi:phosphoribulokinase